MSTPTENNMLSAILLPHQELDIFLQIIRFLSPSGVGSQYIPVLDVEELGTAIRAEIERLTKIEPDLMPATQRGQGEAVKVVRKLPRVVLYAIRCCTE